MPSLHIFGRRWSISSDDFVFPELSEAWIRIVWFIVAFIIYLTKSDSSSCLNLQTFMVVALIANFVSVVMCLAVAYKSSLGTISNVLPRADLPFLIYLRCPFILFEIAWNIVGAVWLSQSVTSKCGETFFVGVLATIVGGWFMTIVLVMGIVLNFDPLGTIHHGDLNMTDEAKKVWKIRLRWACYCASRSDRAKMAFEDVAQLFVDLFLDSDLVWTDVWAALLLIASKEIRILVNQPRNLVNHPAPDWMNLQAARQAMRFALGVYGWPYFLWGRSCRPNALCQLWRRARCCVPHACRCDSALVIKDNCCMCNTAAMLLETGLDETDVFYVNLHNEVWETPFVACFDHSSKSIVISIRGSLSVRDVITDLTAGEDTLELYFCPSVEQRSNDCNANSRTENLSQNPNLPAEQIDPRFLAFSNPLQIDHTNDQRRDDPKCIKCRAHRGMLLSARYVASKLEAEHILDDMFVLQPGYSLVLTGHSLGAAVATLLAIMLKPKYNDLKCFAFSPPGGIISEDGADYTQSFVFTIFYRDDLFPRLTIESMQSFKQNVYDVLSHCNRPKYDILLKGCYKLLCGAGSRHRRPSLEATLSPGSSMPSSPVMPRTLGSSQRQTSHVDYSPLLSPTKHSQKYTDDTPKGFSQRVKLVAAGRILHLTPKTHHRDHPDDQQLSMQSSSSSSSVDDHPTSSSGVSNVWSAKWLHRSHLSTIRMSSSMLIDHMPWTVKEALEACAENRPMTHDDFVVEQPSSSVVNEVVVERSDVSRKSCSQVDI